MKTRSTSILIGLASTLTATLGLAGAIPAQTADAATTITVSSCDETSLDAAIAQANTDNAGDTITFGCSGTISLSSTLDITGDMTLDGTGQQVTLGGYNNGGSGVGVFSVASGVTFTLNALTISGDSAGGGGGLLNNGGTVNITGSTFQENTAATSGGGVDNLGGGTVNITNSTFAANLDINGNGSAVNNDQGTVSITGSAFIQNEFQSGLGTIFNGGGTMSITSSLFVSNEGVALYTFGTANTVITNSSFVENFGGGIDVTGGEASIAFSSFLGNAAFNLETINNRTKVEGSILDEGRPGESPAPPFNCVGIPVDQGYNLETSTDCGFTGTGDLQNTGPNLTGGGGTPLILQQGSPAIDAVPLSLCPAADENGNPRPDDPAETTCDMGATESDYPPVPVMIVSSTDPSTVGQPVTFDHLDPTTAAGRWPLTLTARPPRSPGAAPRP